MNNSITQLFDPNTNEENDNIEYVDVKDDSETTRSISVEKLDFALLMQSMIETMLGLQETLAGKEQDEEAGDDVQNDEYFKEYIKSIKDSTEQSEKRIEKSNEEIRRLISESENRLREDRIESEKRYAEITNKIVDEIDRMDSKIDEKLTSLETKFDSKIDQMNAKIEGKFDQMNEKIDKNNKHVFGLALTAIIGIAAMVLTFGGIAYTIFQLVNSMIPK